MSDFEQYTMSHPVAFSTALVRLDDLIIAYRERYSERPRAETVRNVKFTSTVSSTSFQNSPIPKLPISPFYMIDMTLYV